MRGGAVCHIARDLLRRQAVVFVDQVADAPLELRRFGGQSAGRLDGLRILFAQGLLNHKDHKGHEELFVIFVTFVVCRMPLRRPVRGPADRVCVFVAQALEWPLNVSTSPVTPGLFYTSSRPHRARPMVKQIERLNPRPLTWRTVVARL
jgi:hypothetical protein